MKMRKIGPVMLAGALAPALAAALFWGGGTPAGAVVTTTTSDLSLATSGTVSATGSESVAFSGTAAIDSKMVPDPDFGSPPNVVLTIDLSTVTGTGVSSKTKYVTNARQIFIRPLAAADLVSFTFPYYPSGTNGVGSSTIATATFSLTFNVNLGTVTSASASYTSP